MSLRHISSSSFATLQLQDEDISDTPQFTKSFHKSISIPKELSIKTSKYEYYYNMCLFFIMGYGLGWPLTVLTTLEIPYYVIHYDNDIAIYIIIHYHI